MSTAPYHVLARKYRPSLLAELKGQDALVRTLTNSIESKRIAHAFLLTGIRGVGKTTTARIIARSLNCVGADGKGEPTIQPCGVCPQCVAIQEDRHPDILEMDAASRTGVNDIREIIENSHYLPVMARYKVYIIDEVHMLSNNAFNALLKTLEEPPSHVKFIFATTEIRKIPVTILSRCQRFDLRRLSTKALQDHLREIAGREQVVVEEEALLLLADAAEGSVRDSLSLLDQAIAHSYAGTLPITVSCQTVQEMLGMADRSGLFDLLESCADGAITQALTQLEYLYQHGADVLLVLEQLLELIHFITTLHTSPERGNDLTIPEGERVRGKALGARLSIPQLTKLWQLLLKGLQEARVAPHPYTAAEMVLIRMAYAAPLPSPAELIRTLSLADNKSEQRSAVQTTSSPIAAPVSAPASHGHTTLAAAPVLAADTLIDVVKNPTNFNELVKVFQQEKELILYHHLCEDVQLITFEIGKLEIRLSAYAPQDLPNRVGRLLTEWTGTRWVVVISNTGTAQPTLHETKLQEEEQRKQQAAKHPVVKAALEAFPGAKIVKIHTNLEHTSSITTKKE